MAQCRTWTAFGLIGGSGGNTGPLPTFRAQRRMVGGICASRLLTPLPSFLFESAPAAWFPGLFWWQSNC